jgi:O-antigen ligase
MLKINYSFIIISFLLTSTIILLEQDIVFVLISLIILIITLLYGKDFVLILIIVLQITFSGENAAYYRPFITGLSFAILMYFFLTEYGLNFTRYPKIPKMILYLISFIFFVFTISTSFSQDLIISIAAIARFLIFIIFCYLIYSQITELRKIYSLLFSLLISVFIIGISMLYEFYEKGASFFVNENALLRLGGIYENPNYVGMLLSISIPITLSYLMINQTNTKKLNSIVITGLIFQIIFLLLADSRSSFLSLTISSIIIFSFSPKKIKLFSIALLFFIGVIIIVSFDISFIFELFLRPDRIGTRDMAWSTGLEIISDNYLFGIGPSTYESIFFTYSPSFFIEYLRTGTPGAVSPNPHNLFLYYWAENGILGLLVVIFFFFIFVKISLALIRNSAILVDHIKWIKIAILSICFGILVRSFFEITGVLTYGFITRDLPFWIILIILIYLYQNQEKHKIFSINE